MVLDSRAGPWRTVLVQTYLLFSLAHYSGHQSHLCRSLLLFLFFSFLSRFSSLLRLKPEKLEKELDTYSDSAKKRGAEKMRLPEFAAFLGVPESQALRDLFSLFDEVSAERRSPYCPWDPHNGRCSLCASNTVPSQQPHTFSAACMFSQWPGTHTVIAFVFSWPHVSDSI